MLMPLVNMHLFILCFKRQQCGHLIQQASEICYSMGTHVLNIHETNHYSDVIILFDAILLESHKKM